MGDSSGGGGDTSASKGSDTGDSSKGGDTSSKGGGGGGDNGSPYGADSGYGGGGGYDATGGGGGYDTGIGGGSDTGIGGGSDGYGGAGNDPYIPTTGGADPYTPPEIPSIPNGDGPGPVGGIPGLPDAGGGTNTWGALPDSFLDANNSMPTTVAGVQSSAGSNTGAGSIDELLSGYSAADGTGGSPGVSGIGGTSASAFAAPSGVTAPMDFTSSASDQTDPLGRDTNAGGTSQTRAVNSPGLIDSLGLRGGGTNGVGALVAGAGLLNNLINGRGDTASSDALRGLAAQTEQARREIAERSAPQQATGARVSGAGEQSIAQGQQITGQGRDIISQGQQSIPQGQALQQYVQTGTLPAAYESQVQEGLRSAITRVTANHVQRGMPGDPTRNTVLAEEIRQIEARAPQMRMELARSLSDTGSNIIASGNQTIGAGTGVVSGGNATTNTGGGLVNTGTQTSNALLSQGMQATGLNASIYQTLLADENARNQRRGQSIANFAAALNSTPRRAA